MIKQITDTERALSAQIDEQGGQLEAWRDRAVKAEARVAALEAALRGIDKECFSHVDGRDLFAQMHPRNMLDIKRRVDAREAWFEGDWLSNLWDAIKSARAAMKGTP